MIHYEYLQNNSRTFVQFLDHLVYALFYPALPREFSPLPRPTPPYILKVEKLAESTFHPQKMAEKYVNCEDNFARNVRKSWNVNTFA